MYVVLQCVFFVCFFLFSCLCRKKDGQPIVIEDDRMDGGNVNSIGLKIHQVLRSDMGNYTCELQNEYGIGVSDNAISLDVHCKCQKKSEFDTNIIQCIYTSV